MAFYGRELIQRRETLWVSGHFRVQRTGGTELSEGTLLRRSELVRSDRWLSVAPESLTGRGTGEKAVHQQDKDDCGDSLLPQAARRGHQALALARRDPCAPGCANLEQPRSPSLLFLRGDLRQPSPSPSLDWVSVAVASWLSKGEGGMEREHTCTLMRSRVPQRVRIPPGAAGRAVSVCTKDTVVFTCISLSRPPSGHN